MSRPADISLADWYAMTAQQRRDAEEGIREPADEPPADEPPADEPPADEPPADPLGVPD